VDYGEAYVVTAETSAPLVCSVSNAFGTMGAQDAGDVAVVCSTTAYTVGGTVTGMAAGTTLALQNNGDGVFPVTADGLFTFTRPVAQSGGYEVTVRTHPTGQRCSVQGGTGTVNGASVADVAVTCANLHGLHVDVAGLTGTLVLRNGSDALTVSADGDHAFAQGLLPGEAYEVAVARHPVGQTCTVASGSGVMGGEDVTLAVSCTPNLMVLRLGLGGTVALGQTAAAVQLEEYRPMGGAAVRTLAMPWLGSNRLTVMSDILLYEGHLSRSANGRFLTFAGYDADMGTRPRSSAASATARVVGQVDVNGNFTMPVRLNDAYNTLSVRAAITDDGSRYWLSGEGNGVNTTGGIRYVDGASPTSSVGVSSTVADTHALNFVDGKLVFSATAVGGSIALGYFPNNPLPTAAGEVASSLPGLTIPTGLFPASAFATLDRDGNAVADVAFVAGVFSANGTTANTLNVTKWTFDGSTWTRVANYAPVFTESTGATRQLAVDGLTAVDTPVGVRVYVTAAVTTNSTTNFLATFLDDGTTSSPAASILATSPANTLFRSVAFSPRP
ncbi:MAG: hypothetical protein L0Y66_01010, partial [Myxococcaceae bacterium]|nr:hypothetical protein [Myxococcaceae bacterium]